jgi:(p)ppGpp synthase/HD superfamily hydrolase
VHTDIGTRCVAAKVDRRLTPLRTVLRNGQTVEIITAKGARPDPSWVNFVVSAKARNSVRQYLKSLRRTEAIALGKRLLNQALTEFHLELEDVPLAQMQAAISESGMRDIDELFEHIGLGERLAALVARRLLPTGEGEPGTQDTSGPMAIAGTEGLLVTYARCCFPIPYDPVIAYLSSGRGIVVHRDVCVNVEDYHKHPEKWLPVSWQNMPDRLFTSQIRVDVPNRVGMLAAVAAAISAANANIEGVSLKERDSASSQLEFDLRVRDRKHLADIIRHVRRMADVVRVTRMLAAHARKRNEDRS